jgi:hypothetical protein
MTNAELNQKQLDIHNAAARLSALIGELVGPTPSSQIANAAYAAQKTDENVQAVVDKALAGGEGAPQLRVIAGDAPAKG